MLSATTSSHGRVRWDQVKNPSANARDARGPVWEDSLEQETATHPAFVPGKSHGQEASQATGLGIQSHD